MPNLRANAENAQLIRELGADKTIVGTDGPEQNSVEALDAVAGAMWNLAEATEDVGVDIAIEFDWSPLVKSLQSAVRVAEIADRPRVGVRPLPCHPHEAEEHKRELGTPHKARAPRRHA